MDYNQTKMPTHNYVPVLKFYVFRYYTSAESRSFLRSNVDHLQRPEEYSQMPIPGILEFHVTSYTRVGVSFKWKHSHWNDLNVHCMC